MAIIESSAIAAASVSFSSATTIQAVNVSMLDKSMDLQKAQMNSFIDTMQSAPSFGHKLDVRV